MPRTWVDIKHVSDYHRAPNRCNDAFQVSNPCRSEKAAYDESAEVDRGGGSKCRAISVCRDEIDAGGGSNPCAWNAPIKAINRKFLHGIHGNYGGWGLECDWGIIGAPELVQMSSDARYSNATIKDSSNNRVSLYKQLLFGIQYGSNNTKGSGFCDNMSNLLTPVHTDGRTCYDMIKEQINADTATRKGREFCASNKSHNQCKCINISQSGGVGYCLQNRSIPGCDKVVQTYEGIPEKARIALPLANQSTGCFNGTACAGDVFTPEITPAVCNNTIQVCEQNIEIGDITGGKVDIEQKMDCDNTSGGGGGGGGGGTEEETISIPRSVGEVRSFLPTNLGDVRTNKKKQIGVATLGGGITMSLCCVLILLVLSSSGGPIRRRYR
tara:strand:+ start:943 stop:2091 length:1149 start_codon:yes stop_codon:yes gene_type:complete